MNYKKAAWMSAFLAGALVLAGCQSDSDTEDTTSAVNTNTSAVKQSSTLSLEAEDYDTEINDAQKISLDEQSGDVKIKKAGTYQLSGTVLLSWMPRLPLFASYWIMLISGAKTVHRYM